MAGAEHSNAQILKLPFQFKREKFSKQKIVFTGNLTKKNGTQVVSITYDESVGKVHLVDKILFSANSRRKIIPITAMGKDKFLDDIDFYDFNNDGLIELVFAKTGNFEISFYYLNPSEKKTKPKKFFSMGIDRRFFNGRLYFYHINLKDGKKELIVYVATVNPANDNAKRGFWAFEMPKGKLRWKYLTADHLLENSVVIGDFDNKKEITFLSNSIKQGLFYFNGKFRKVNPKNIPAKFAKIVAPDFSTDMNSYFCILDGENGAVKLRRFITDLMIWPTAHPLTENNDSEYVFLLRKRKPTQKISNFFYYNSRTNKLSPKWDIAIEHNLSLYSFYLNGSLAFQGTNNVYEILPNGKFKILRLPFHIREQYDTKEKGKHIYWVTKNGENYLANENREIIAVLPRLISTMEYFPLINKFIIRSFAQKYRFGHYRLTHLPIWKRITNTGYLLITFILTFIILVILGFWVNTLKKSRDKIKKQQEELEKVTAKMIQSEKLAVLGTISASIAHQLNSPLGAVLNSAQRMMESGIDNPNLVLIEKAAHRSKAIVQRFLMTARPVENEKREISLKKSVDDFFELFETDFRHAGIRIIIKNIANVCLKMTASEMFEILTNIFFNAKDSLLESHNHEKEITFDSRVNANNVEITITDNGKGFPEEILETPIKAFRSTKGEGQGSGLGLWLVNKIVTEAGGKIELGNLPKGAYVKLTIPLAKNGNCYGFPEK
jgi:signal transduction histidine kinase